MRLFPALAVLAALAAGAAMAQSLSGTPNPQTVTQIQKRLQQDGYYQGPVTGVWDTTTSQSLSTWQRDQGLPATGQLDSQTVAGLGVTGDTQQAQTPQSPGQVETLRERGMSAPNVQGQGVPEDPNTGVPRPGATPGQLENPARP